MRIPILLSLGLALGACQLPDSADRAPQFRDDGSWQKLTLADFENVNGDADTWKQVGETILCSGLPLGGARTHQEYTDFELVLEWKHQTHGGNSGVFLWCPEEAFTDLPPGQLPRTGIEVQVLDLGYEENWEANEGKPSDWFTSHGDIFPVGAASMTAETPEITYHQADGTPYVVGRPDNPRSFPTKRLVKPAGEWNHYAIRAVAGEVTLWVNGERVNRGFACQPSTGYLALESEGAAVEYRHIRLRELR